MLTEPVYLYWNNWNRYEYELLDMREPKMKEEITKSCLAHIPLKYYKKVEIKPGETGVLYFDNQMVVDLKARTIEINGQEILTADRIGIRVNLLCTYKVTQVKRMLETIKNLEAQIYACVQLVVREYIGKYRLDEDSGAKRRNLRFYL
ncbi:SPFH domain-containing protein [Lacrimispora sp. BS-2]|uniref:SPFH domain-containing protein n=1 Tax=Lacrimispora sp. BS-2 TaxID=3151850 RepID=A0AAU7PTX5_9FIRM